MIQVGALAQRFILPCSWAVWKERSNMRPISFHSHIRRIITVGQVIPIIIAGAVASVFFSPFLIGAWIQEKLHKRREARNGKGS